MARIRLVDDVDHFHRLDVAAFRRGTTILFGIDHGLASLAPVVALEDVVVIGDTDRWRMAHRLAEGPAVLIEFAQVVQDRRIGGGADDPETAVILVELVA